MRLLLLVPLTLSESINVPLEKGCIAGTAGHQAIMQLSNAISLDRNVYHEKMEEAAAGR